MHKLFEQRKNKKYSCEYMAKLLGISKTYYWQIENCKRRITYNMALEISKIFKLKPDDIFYDDTMEKIESKKTQ